MKEVRFMLLLFPVLRCVYALNVKDLGGVWQIQDADKEHKLVGTVPGGIYTDLMRSNIIDDVYHGFNDVKSRWVAKKSWIYWKTFQVDSDFLNHKQLNVNFNGLDSFADVFLNGALIGSSNNMFLRYSFDVKNHLKVGDNEIKVVFRSPIVEAKKLFDEQSKNYTVLPKCVPNEYNGECHVNHIRKMQASFSWDWGPALPSMGIWKSVRLEAYNTTTIKDIMVHYEEGDEEWNVLVTTYLNSNSKQKLDGSLVAVVILSDTDRIESVFELNLTGQYEFVHQAKLSIPKVKVNLWWPNGMGKQNLYQMKVTYVSADNREETTKRFKIGIRSVELIQDTLVKGRSFYFKVNGIPFFAKGTNIIPSNILPELGNNQTKMRFLLQSSKDVHMNMIRVWGGGIYESDEFYDIADEMGILIWQDFMFACSMYPANRDFISTVKDEVKDQVRRLQRHTSVILWAGNNENEAALRGNWYGTASEFDLFKEDYVKLYAKTIKTALLETDERALFLTSSPTNGVQSDLEGYVAINPYDPLYGDVHFYNYVFDGWNKNVNPITRFASEYGYQSLPSIRSILTATNNISDLDVSSDFMLHRQHHLLGYSEMELLIRHRMKLPNRKSANYNRAFIFYTQIHQAMSIKTQTEYYRQWMSYINDAGEGNTMGALYWQLNDVWICPSWASIDYNNNWKMLHYYAKEFFAPIIITFHLNSSDNVDVYVISDEQRPLQQPCIARISTLKWNGFEHGSEIVIAFNLKPGSQIVTSFLLDDFLSKSPDCGANGNARDNCFLYATLEHQDVKIAPDNLLMPAPLKNSAMKNATVSIKSVKKMQDKTFKITVQSDNVAAFVWLETEIPGQFSQNGYFQVTPQHDVYFTAVPTTNAEELAESLTVTHLLDKQYL